MTAEPVPAVVHSSVVCDRSFAKMYCDPPQDGVPSVAGAVHVSASDVAVVAETVTPLICAGTV